MLAKGKSQASSPTGITTGNKEQKIPLRCGLNAPEVTQICEMSLSTAQHQSQQGCRASCLAPLFYKHQGKPKPCEPPHAPQPHVTVVIPVGQQCRQAGQWHQCLPHSYQNLTQLPPQASSISTPTPSCVTTFPRWKSFSMVNAVQHQAQHQCKIATISTELTQMLFKERPYQKIISTVQLSQYYLFCHSQEKKFFIVFVILFIVLILFVLLICCPAEHTQVCKTNHVLNQDLFQQKPIRKDLNILSK